MNIFEALKQFAKKRIWKLLYDAEGKAFLYNIHQKEFKEITLYPQEKFRRPFRYDKSLKNYESEFQKWQLSFDVVRVYSAQIGEDMVDGVKKPIIRYGFIDESGYAITHATYERVQAFQNGRAVVYLNDMRCIIDLLGCPLLNGLPFYKAEFVSQYSYAGFTICCIEGKYGLVNKYRYLCIPCEYDSMEFNHYSGINCFVMKKDGKNYTAIIEGDSICNIINYTPTSIMLSKNMLVIEEEFMKDGDTFTKFGLLNRGGIRILKSEFDSITILSNYFALVSKDELKQLIYLSSNEYEIVMGPSKDITYGEGYKEDSKEVYFYATKDEYNIRILGIKGKDGFRRIDNWTFGPDDLDCDEDLRPRGYDKIYFSYHGKPNNYFAVVVDNKTELIDLNGDQVIPFVIPSDCHVETDTYNEGIVGVSKKIQEDSDENNETTCYSFINSEGKILTDFIYDRIEKFENGQAKAYYSLYGETCYGSCEQIIDKTGKIIREHMDWDSEGPNTDWADMIDDTFEGDPEAYWNID